MRALHFKFASPTDIARVMRVAAAAEISCSAPEAFLLWSAYSESFCAGWMGLPESDDALLAIIEETAVARTINF